MKNLEPSIFRQRLIIEGHYSIPIDGEKVRDYLTELSKVVDMVIFSGPYSWPPDKWDNPEVTLEELKRAGIKDKSIEELERKGVKTVQLLEYPHYTRPQEFDKHKVPTTLLSGDHKKITAWRLREAFAITKKRRPDLLV